MLSSKDVNLARKLVDQLVSISTLEAKLKIKKLLRKITKTNHQTFSKSELLAVYKNGGGTKGEILDLLRKKPIRTLSGVTIVTVLTKPYFCPGKCIYCPADIRMPKSYIASEPGAQRAGKYNFDPYLQVYFRLKALEEIGHIVSKIELIVLGGTWSVYNHQYQVWFIKRLFEALNDYSRGIIVSDKKVVSINWQDQLEDTENYNSRITKKLREGKVVDELCSYKDLIREQQKNEKANSRCVGLVLETRPDVISKKEVIWLRKLGATKIQVGIQSLNDQVLLLNKRGHQVVDTKRAFALLRQAGFKIHGHWMPNLYGSNVLKDKQDYLKIFKQNSFRPDELKIYPCSLIKHTELITYYKTGQWMPYSRKELIDILSYVVTHTPLYCRLTRVVRDIPGSEIMVGNKQTNIREVVEKLVDARKLKDIRAREIKNSQVEIAKLIYKCHQYHTDVSVEYFLEYVTNDDKLVGFLRLSLPTVTNFIKELRQVAMIREIHVYGKSLSVERFNLHYVQHQGIGTNLIDKAVNIGQINGFKLLGVISAVGTREYYRKRGFVDGKLYQIKVI